MEDKTIKQTGSEQDKTSNTVEITKDRSDQGSSAVSENLTENNFTNDQIGKIKQGRHPNSLANLKPFKKGVTGNPGGRITKYKKMAKALKKFGKGYRTIEEWDSETRSIIKEDAQFPLKEEVLLRIWLKAIEGDLKFIAILAELECLDD